MFQQQEQGLSWQLFATEECDHTGPDRDSEFSSRDELVFAHDMEEVVEDSCGQSCFFQHIDQGRNDFSHQSLLLKIVDNLANISQELEFLRLFFLMDVLKVADRLE